MWIRLWRNDQMMLLLGLCVFGNVCKGFGNDDVGSCQVEQILGVTKAIPTATYEGFSHALRPPSSQVGEDYFSLSFKDFP